MNSDITKLTFETDDNRLAASPSIIVEPTGRLIVFYEKQYASGKTSSGILSFTVPFTVNVPAGSGTLNGTPISWGSTTVTATAEKFELVYVTAAGVVGITDDFPMSFTKDVITLGFVFSGLSQIVSIENIENEGHYIYGQKQTFNVDHYEWTDYEFFLNTGEQPKAFYDTSSGFIYLTYSKDDASFTRVIDSTDETTWAYLSNLIISGPNVQMRNPPTNTFELLVGSGIRSTYDLASDTLPLGVTGLGYSLIGALYEPFIFLPYVEGSYTDRILYPIQYEFFTRSGDVYTLVDSTDVYSNYNIDRWYQWTGSYDVIYIGIRVRTTFGFQEDYVTDPRFYKILNVYPAFEYRSESLTSISSEITESFVNLKVGAGIRSQLYKSFEQDQLTDAEQDSFNFTVGAGIRSQLYKVSEQEQTNDFEQDSFNLSVGAGIRSTYSNWQSL